MIDMEKIKLYYSPREQQFEDFLLKEYLQYQILHIIFSSAFADSLSFLWWTAIRLVYDSTRFSEDLDFDNFWLSEKDFANLSEYIKKELELLGFHVEIKNIYKWAYRYYIKLPKILQEIWFLHFEEEKILIQIDTVKQDYTYESANKILDKFDIYKMIKVCPLDIILAKKIHALIERKRIKWRDFFDIVYLYRFITPNFDYLQYKIWIKNSYELKNKLNNFIEDVDLHKAAQDVEPFLINNDEINRVLHFKEFIDTI